MEFYLLIALIFIYIISAFTGNRHTVKRFWTMAFIFSFILMGISLGTLRLSNEDVMLNAGQFNWYYFLYIFSALCLAVGFINLWIYRHELLGLCKKNDATDKE